MVKYYRPVCLDKELVQTYSKLCKENNWVMKGRIESFIKSELKIFGIQYLDDGKNQKLKNFVKVK